MISDAFVNVTCDGCHTVEEIQLTATAGGGWDERNVEASLEDIGWSIDGDNHYCEDCTEERDNGDPDEDEDEEA